MRKKKKYSLKRIKEERESMTAVVVERPASNEKYRFIQPGYLAQSERIPEDRTLRSESAEVLIVREPGKHIMVYGLVSQGADRGSPLTGGVIDLLNRTRKKIMFHGLTRAEVSAILRALGPESVAVAEKEKRQSHARQP